MKVFCKTILLLLIIVIGTHSHAQQIKKWSLSDLETVIAKAEGPMILNFWATFCKPCIAEMPHFQQLAEKYKAQGVKLYLVNLDAAEAYPKKIQSVMQKRKITAPVTFLTETNADLFCPAVDKDWSGAIPAGLFINNKTGYRKFYEEELSKEKLEKEITELIKK